MEKPGRIIRRSIHVFLLYYHHFATSAAFLVFPVAASILLSQSLLSSSPLFMTLYSRLQLLFESAGFPYSPFFSLLNLKLSQTLSSSLFTLPFTLSFLLVAKSFVIQILSRRPVSSFLGLYHPLLLTHIVNSFVLLSANSAALSLMFLVFNSFEALGFSSSNFLLFLSAAGAVLYSVVIANAITICNLALIVAGMEDCSGYSALLKACMLMRGKAATALSLALPTNLALAAFEALFQYRVVKAYHLSGQFEHSFTWEAPLIVYLYSLLIVLDTVMGCIFYRSCKSDNLSNWNNISQYDHQIEIPQWEDDGAFTYPKIAEELPL